MTEDKEHLWNFISGHRLHQVAGVLVGMGITRGYNHLLARLREIKGFRE